jgi:NAD+ diphosphatase
MNILAVRRNRLLAHPDDLLAPRYLTEAELPAGSRLLPLDSDGEGNAFALLEIDAALGDDAALATLGLGAASGRFADIMTQLGRFEGPERQRVLRAIALAQWSYENRYCSNCGAELRWDDAGRTKVCANPEKSHRHFARTDPATIVLVRDGERALLGRQRGWPAGMYSTLAGFVEPGETAEDAVVREVYEETGVRVGEVNYFGSESWPFPRSLMLAFTARAETTDVRVGEELDDARWFSRDDIVAMQDRTRSRLPHFETIARRLLDLAVRGS